MIIPVISLESVDRTIYEHIRLELVRRGFLPNKWDFQNDKDGYEAAREVIKNDPNKFLIDVFGTGASESRDKKHSHSLVVNRIGISPSDLGGGSEFYKPNTNDQDEVENFTKGKYPDTASNLNYEVRVITNSIKAERIIFSVLTKALGYTKELATVTSGSNTLSSNTVTCKFEGTVDVTSTDFIELIYRYNLKDVWLEEGVTEYEGTIAVLKNIKIKVGDDKDDTDLTQTEVGDPIP